MIAALKIISRVHSTVDGPGMGGGGGGGWGFESACTHYSTVYAYS